MGEFLPDLNRISHTDSFPDLDSVQLFVRSPDPRFTAAIRFVLERNILCGDALTMLQDDGEPIIFSEWSLVMGDKVKRRDFRLDEMLEGNVEEGQTMSLFGASGAPTTRWEYDEETKSMIPSPIREYALCSFYEVMNA